MILSGIFSFYDNNKPLLLEDAFYFSKNVLSNAPLDTEDGYLQYGEFRIMKSLESLFRQSWLPVIKKTDNSTYIEPNLAKDSKIINETQLKDIFIDNQFVKNIAYYHLSLPPNMQISHKAEKGISGAISRINLNNKWVVMSITLSYLSPEKMVYGEMNYQEKWLLVFSPSKRKEYEKWYSLLSEELKSVHRWDKAEESILKSLQK